MIVSAPYLRARMMRAFRGGGASVLFPHENHADAIP